MLVVRTPIAVFGRFSLLFTKKKRQAQVFVPVSFHDMAEIQQDLFNPSFHIFLSFVFTLPSNPL